MSTDQLENRVRLNKLIADAGIASRRAADGLIADGAVTVNGKRVYELGIKVDPSKDKVIVNGKPLRAKAEHLYMMFHKPKGVLTTMDDPLDRPTVKDYLGKLKIRVFPVGRLDWDSEGLLILTNDGDYANRVLNPKSDVTKTYLVKVDGFPKDESLDRLRKGVTIEGGKVAAKFVQRIKRGETKYSWVKIIITEGKNRQIRQMFEKIGLDVLKLQRTAIGKLRLGALERGQIVFLNDVAADRVFMPDSPETKSERDSKRNSAPEVRKGKTKEERAARTEKFAKR